MSATVGDSELVAYCGLYCGACGAYRKGRCPGCHGNDKATWCAVRTCCRSEGYASCAQCAAFADPQACRKYNNPIARIFGFVFRSNRAACIRQIRERGLEEHARIMAASGRQSLPR